MPTEEKELNSKQLGSLTKKWLKEIDDALKREKTYRENGREIVKLYEGDKKDDTPFAILYSNTEVLAPALYNARPIPIVQRRYKDADPVGKAVSDTSTRLLKFFVDNDSENYDGYDDLMQAAVLDGLLTNRGLTRFRYVPNEGMPECVYGDTVRWDKFFHGYARTWKKVPWIGFEHDMTKEEIQANFKGKHLKKLQSQEDSESEGGSQTKEELTGVITFKVYEIWDKKTKKVMFFSHCCDEPLRLVDDPLGLSSFFPVPRPLNFTRKTSTLIPTPLYDYYAQQAKELNDLTLRLKAIIRAIRYRGAYNATVDGIEKMLNAEDNDLVPVENMQSMPENQSMDKLLYIVPVQELAVTAQQLYQARESVKHTIYEITGISDILRGSSVASETATAQNIKNQWGTLRLKKMQKEVQRYCRDTLAIMLEIAAGKFETETIQKMTGLVYLTNEQKQKAEMAVQQSQAPRQQMPGQPPAPPPPPPPPQLMHTLKQPTWEQIMEVFRDDVTRQYKTDIETNSTIDAEAAQDKQDIAELLNALSQFMNGLAPLVQSGTMPMEIAKQMLLVITRRYNFGTQLEDALQSMQEPKKDGENPEDKAKAEAAKIEAQVKAAEGQQRMQILQKETQAELALMDKRLQIEQAELAIKQQELEFKREELRMKNEAAILNHTLKMQAMQAKAAQPAAPQKGESDNATV